MWTHDVFIITVIVIALSAFTFANITNCEHMSKSFHSISDPLLLL